jgi:hypothetical protein
VSPDPFIETFTGVRFRPLAPVVRHIRIEDVAHALANQCRFSGHVRHRYSVAEHSVRVSELVAAWRAPRSVVLWALLHDASEAYLVDLPTPLKAHALIGNGYRASEDHLMRAVSKRFRLPKKQPPIVARADAVLLATEVRDLMFNRPAHWRKLTEKPLPDRIRPWPPDVAEYEFLRRFRLLTGGKSHG